MRRRAWLGGLLAGGAGLAGLWLWRNRRPPEISEADFAAHFARPLPPPPEGVSVYHLGHSLVGRDMPAILAQLAPHDYALQLGWGTSLRGHWTGDIPGFTEENNDAHFRPAAQALDSGEYPVVVLTEMVEIRDAIRYFDSPEFLARWVARIRKARPEARVYLYETWHRLDDPEGWLDRLDRDLPRYWEGALLRGAKAWAGVGTIHVIPGGQVMAAVTRAAEQGQIAGLTSRTQLFAKDDEGRPDPIHFNDIGAVLMALTHYAVIYQRPPPDLPRDLRRADGSLVTPMATETVQALQEIVWQVVTSYAPTGVPQRGTP